MKPSNPHISIVSPVYRADYLIDSLIERLQRELHKITDRYEIILVDDSSLDDSWAKIQHHARLDARITGIKLSRNFGQHYAITAGLDHARGEWVVVMDCDLQDRPEAITRLYAKAQEGYAIVRAQRMNRQDAFFKKISSRLFYAMLSYLTGVRQDSTLANFGIYHEKVIAATRKMRESIRYFPTMIQWVGFTSTCIAVVHAGRETGKTSYNVRKRLNLALDIILAYSDKPLRLTVGLGLVMAFSSFGFAVYNIIKALRGDIAVLGYASLIVSIWFLAGLIISILGIIGLYVGKTFEGVKNRPIYVIDEITRYDPVSSNAFLPAVAHHENGIV